MAGVPSSPRQAQERNVAVWWKGEKVLPKFDISLFVPADKTQVNGTVHRMKQAVLRKVRESYPNDDTLRNLKEEKEFNLLDMDSHVLKDVSLPGKDGYLSRDIQDLNLEIHGKHYATRLDFKSERKVMDVTDILASENYSCLTAMMELIDNAVQYTLESKSDEKRINVELTELPQKSVFTIRDSGVGAGCSGLTRLVNSGEGTMAFDGQVQKFTVNEVICQRVFADFAQSAKKKNVLSEFPDGEAGRVRNMLTQHLREPLSVFGLGLKFAMVKLSEHDKDSMEAKLISRPETAPNTQWNIEGRGILHPKEEFRTWQEDNNGRDSGLEVTLTGAVGNELPRLLRSQNVKVILARAYELYLDRSVVGILYGILQRKLELDVAGSSGKEPPQVPEIQVEIRDENSQGTHTTTLKDCLGGGVTFQQSMQLSNSTEIEIDASFSESFSGSLRLLENADSVFRGMLEVVPKGEDNRQEHVFFLVAYFKCEGGKPGNPFNAGCDTYWSGRRLLQGENEGMVHFPLFDSRARLWDDHRFEKDLLHKNTHAFLFCPRALKPAINKQDLFVDSFFFRAVKCVLGGDPRNERGVALFQSLLAFLNDCHTRFDTDVTVEDGKLICRGATLDKSDFVRVRTVANDDEKVGQIDRIQSSNQGGKEEVTLVLILASGKMETFRSGLFKFLPAERKDFEGEKTRLRESKPERLQLDLPKAKVPLFDKGVAAGKDITLKFKVKNVGRNFLSKDDLTAAVKLESSKLERQKPGKKDWELVDAKITLSTSQAEKGLIACKFALKEAGGCALRFHVCFKNGDTLERIEKDAKVLAADPCTLMFEPMELPIRLGSEVVLEFHVQDKFSNPIDSVAQHLYDIAVMEPLRVSPLDALIKTFRDLKAIGNRMVSATSVLQRCVTLHPQLKNTTNTLQGRLSNGATEKGGNVFLKQGEGRGCQYALNPSYKTKDREMLQDIHETSKSGGRGHPSSLRFTLSPQHWKPSYLPHGDPSCSCDVKVEWTGGTDKAPRKLSGTTSIHVTRGPLYTIDFFGADPGTRLAAASYCLDTCDDESEDRMVGCDGICDNWFHLHCVGLDDFPPREENYYCSKCKVQSTVLQKVVNGKGENEGLHDVVGYDQWNNVISLNEKSMTLNWNRSSVNCVGGQVFSSLIGGNPPQTACNIGIVSRRGSSLEMLLSDDTAVELDGNPTDGFVPKERGHLPDRRRTPQVKEKKRAVLLFSDPPQTDSTFSWQNSVGVMAHKLRDSARPSSGGACDFLQILPDCVSFTSHQPEGLLKEIHEHEVADRIRMGQFWVAENGRLVSPFAIFREHNSWVPEAGSTVSLTPPLGLVSASGGVEVSDFVVYEPGDPVDGASPIFPPGSEMLVMPLLFQPSDNIESLSWKIRGGRPEEKGQVTKAQKDSCLVKIVFDDQTEEVVIDLALQNEAGQTLDITKKGTDSEGREMKFSGGKSELSIHRAAPVIKWVKVGGLKLDFSIKYRVGEPVRVEFVQAHGYCVAGVPLHLKATLMDQFDNEVDISESSPDSWIWTAGTDEGDGVSFTFDAETSTWISTSRLFKRAGVHMISVQVPRDGAQESLRHSEQVSVIAGDPVLVDTDAVPQKKIQNGETFPELNLCLKDRFGNTTDKSDQISLEADPVLQLPSKLKFNHGKAVLRGSREIFATSTELSTPFAVYFSLPGNKQLQFGSGLQGCLEVSISPSGLPVKLMWRDGDGAQKDDDGDPLYTFTAGSRIDLLSEIRWLTDKGENSSCDAAKIKTNPSGILGQPRRQSSERRGDIKVSIMLKESPGPGVEQEKIQCSVRVTPADAEKLKWTGPPNWGEDTLKGTLQFSDAYGNVTAVPQGFVLCATDVNGDAVESVHNSAGNGDKLYVTFPPTCVLFDLSVMVKGERIGEAIRVSSNESDEIEESIKRLTKEGERYYGGEAERLLLEREDIETKVQHENTVSVYLKPTPKVLRDGLVAKFVTDKADPGKFACGIDVWLKSALGFELSMPLDPATAIFLDHQGKDTLPDFPEVAPLKVIGRLDQMITVHPGLQDLGKVICALSRSVLVLDRLNVLDLSAGSIPRPVLEACQQGWAFLGLEDSVLLRPVHGVTGRTWQGIVMMRGVYDAETSPLAPLPQSKAEERFGYRDLIKRRDLLEQFEQRRKEIRDKIDRAAKLQDGGVEFRSPKVLALLEQRQTEIDQSESAGAVSDDASRRSKRAASSTDDEHYHQQQSERRETKRARK